MVGWPIPHPFQPLSGCFPVLPGLQGWRLRFLDSLAAKVWRPVKSCALNARMWDVEDNREAQVFPSCFGCFLLVIKSLGFSAGMASVSGHQPVGVRGVVIRTSSPSDPYIKANVTNSWRQQPQASGLWHRQQLPQVGSMMGTFWVVPGGPAHSPDLSIVLQEPNFLN